MNAILALLRKDLRQHFSNRRVVLMSLVAPILIAAFFGSLFGDKGANKPADIPLAVTDLDGSELSRDVIARLQADKTLKISLLGEAEAAAQVRAGKQRAAIVLPAGFGQQASRALFGGGAKPELKLVYDPSQTMVLGLVRGLLAQHVMQPVSQRAFGANSPALADVRQQVQTSQTLPAGERSELLAMFDSIARVQDRAASSPQAAASSPLAGGFSLPFETREVEARAEGPGAGYNSYAHSFAGMGVQFILLMGVDMGIGLLAMRRHLRADDRRHRPHAGSHARPRDPGHAAAGDAGRRLGAFVRVPALAAGAVGLDADPLGRGRLRRDDLARPAPGGRGAGHRGAAGLQRALRRRGAVALPLGRMNRAAARAACYARAPARHCRPSP